jgi:hypothetical protein
VSDIFEKLELTGELAGIAEMVGKQRAYALAKEFSDLRKIYFPKKKKGKAYDRLVKILGAELANSLCELYASELVDISQQKRVEMIIKRHNVGILALLGYSDASIAHQMKITPRRVKEILKDLSLGQLNLFENQKVLPSPFSCGSAEPRNVAMRGDFSGTSLR